MTRAFLPALLLTACGGLDVPARGPLDDFDLLYTSVSWDFFDAEPGHDELRLLKPDGQVLTLVGAHKDGRIQHAQWSPDGRQVAFTRTVFDVAEPGLRDQVEVVRPGGAPRVLASIGAGQVEGPQWSPDGKQIALTLTLFGEPRRRVLVVSALGGQARFLSPPDVDATSPRWTRDGRSLLFLGRDGAELWKVEVATGVGGPIVHEGKIYEMAPAPNGSRILVVVIGSVYTVDLEGGDPVTIASDWGENFTYAPSGRWLAFDRAGENGRQLFVVSTRSGSEPRLAHPGLVQGRFSWAPRGEWLAFTSEQKLWIVRADGSSLIEVTDGSRYDVDPVWRPRH